MAKRINTDTYYANQKRSTVWLPEYQKHEVDLVCLDEEISLLDFFREATTKLLEFKRKEKEKNAAKTTKKTRKARVSKVKPPGLNKEKSPDVKKLP